MLWKRQILYFLHTPEITDNLKSSWFLYYQPLSVNLLLYSVRVLVKKKLQKEKPHALDWPENKATFITARTVLQNLVVRRFLNKSHRSEKKAQKIFQRFFKMKFLIVFSVLALSASFSEATFGPFKGSSSISASGGGGGGGGGLGNILAYVS